MTPNEVINLLQKAGISQWDDAYDVRQRLNQMENLPKWHLSNGVSKICLVFEDAPFVIKWSYGDECGYDEAYEEAQIYHKAQVEGISDLFPPTALLCQIDGINFVVQSKVDFSASEISRKDYLRYKKISRTAKSSTVDRIEREFSKGADGYGRELDSVWAKMLITLYGKRVCKKLCEFVKENHINDLHEDNIGYRNNRPVILDFSGYHRCDY